MTNDEAIYVLKNTAWLGWGDKQKENVTEAVQMAVEALQRETSGDAIDRHEAIRIASGYCHPANVAKELAKLPSVQPEPKWIPCRETVDIPDHEILACDKYGEEMFGYLSHEDDQWLCESDGCMMYDPIAWREKPEPYQEGE